MYNRPLSEVMYMFVLPPLNILHWKRLITVTYLIFSLYDDEYKILDTILTIGFPM